MWLPPARVLKTPPWYRRLAFCCNGDSCDFYNDHDVKTTTRIRRRLLLLLLSNDGGDDDNDDTRMMSAEYQVAQLRERVVPAS